MLDYLLIAAVPVSMAAGIILIIISIKGWPKPSSASHRHPANLRRGRNEAVDIKEIIETAEIRRG